MSLWEPLTFMLEFLLMSQDGDIAATFSCFLNQVQ